MDGKIETLSAASNLNTNAAQCSSFVSKGRLQLQTALSILPGRYPQARCDKQLGSLKDRNQVFYRRKKLGQTPYPTRDPIRLSDQRYLATMTMLAREIYESIPSLS